MGIEAGFKFVSPCPYLPDYIAFAKRVLKLLTANRISETADNISY